MRMTPYPTQCAASKLLAAGETITDVARALGMSRETVRRIKRYGPSAMLKSRSSTTVETITWFLAAYYSGAPVSWISQQLGLNSSQLDRIMGTGGDTLPWVDCPTCGATVRGLCLACFLARRAGNKH